MALAAALIVGQLWLGEITRPRPKKMTFQDLLDSVNKGDETRPIPYIRGKWKTTPQRIWLGDFNARAVERDSHWTDYLWAGAAAFLLDAITVSYRYYVGQGFALCWGPINRVHQVYVDDLPCAIPPVVDNAGGSLQLDDPQLFGGDQPPGLGGVYAVCDVIAGNYTQGRNAYIQSLEGNIPALRGVAALVVRGPSGATESGYFSALQLNLREWAVEVMAWPDVLGDGNNRLSDDSYNRVHSLYEWATSADYGAEYPTSRIHRASWLEASQTVFDEGLGFRGEINTGENVRQVFDAIKDSIDAEIYEHPVDGLKVKLIRKDYSIPALKVLDESNCDVVEEYTPGDLADTFNRTELRFIDASNNYQPKPAIYEDPANRTLRRFGSVKSIEYPGVGSAALAQLLVTREGRAAAQPLPPLVLNSGEAARDLWPGDCYQFQWSDPLVRKIFRVHARTPSVAFEAPRSFRIQSTEDQYSIGMSVFGAPEGTDASDPVDCWDTAPPDPAFDTANFPPDGLEYTLMPGLAGELQSWIRGGIDFGTYACGQYARVYVTEPGGVETLSPIRVMPDAGTGLGTFNWPALTSGTYTFCIQTFSLTGVTTGNKVCASIGAASFSASPSGSVSPSASQSPSPSPSTSPSSSASPSISPSPSPSFSPSVSPSGSASPSASQSPSGSVSPSHSQSPSSSASPSGPSLLDDLIAHWKLNEASGTRVDSHGSNDLTDNNSVPSDTGKIGDAAKFSRTFPPERWLSHADNTDLSMGDIDFTIAFWAYIDTLSVGNPQDCISKWDFAAGREEYLCRFNSSNKFEFFVRNTANTTTTSIASTTSISAATWYFVMMWHDAAGNTLNVSVDNGAANSVGYSGGVRDSTSNLNIGRLTDSTESALLGGRLDSISIWKRLLSSGEKAALYNSGAGLDYPF